MHKNVEKCALKIRFIAKIISCTFDIRNGNNSYQKVHAPIKKVYGYETEISRW